MSPLSNAWADENAHLLGDFGGVRSDLSDHGLELEGVLTTDFISNLSGGARRGTVVEGDLDLTATLDTEKAGLWKGGKAFVYVLGTFGDSASELVGDAQGSSNIEAPESIKVYEAWFDQSLLDGSVSILAGLHDYNSEFDAVDYGATLRNSSFGIEPATSQVGPSIFPATSLGLRVRVQPYGPLYLQSALYDGISGDPENSRGTHIRVAHDEGYFFGSEAGVLSDEPSDKAGYYKAALGWWYQSTNSVDFSDTERTNNRGIYLLGERSLWSPDGSTSGLGGFFQIGAAKSDRNRFDRYFGTGLSYTGLFSGREEDIVTCGVAIARNSGRFVSENEGAKRAETVFEVSYRAKITDAIFIQPDLQYIVHPDTDPSRGNAVVAGVRIELGL